MRPAQSLTLKEKESNAYIDSSSISTSKMIIDLSASANTLSSHILNVIIINSWKAGHEQPPRKKTKIKDNEELSSCRDKSIDIASKFEDDEIVDSGKVYCRYCQVVKKTDKSETDM